MSLLAKLTIKSVSRNERVSPTEARRNKLLAAIDDQLKVADAATRGEQYLVKRQRWVKNEAGEKVLVEKQRAVKSWFFAQDGGYYVQCKYGARTLQLTNDGNAIFVKGIADVAGVLTTLRSAIQNGELDNAVANAINKRELNQK